MLDIESALFEKWYACTTVAAYAYRQYSSHQVLVQRFHRDLGTSVDDRCRQNVFLVLENEYG